MNQANKESTGNTAGEPPRGNSAGFIEHFRADFVSGMLVFLIALPLCLGIAIASGYPPIAGIFTAIIGSLVTTFISNSELTIKGPAAGLIVIAIGCVNDFGGPESVDAYRAALAVGVAAAVLQILFGVFRAGILGEFFPSSTVHGMLAAIGVIIMIKQFPVALGVDGKGEPLEMLREFPHYLKEANPAIACIGFVSILIMFAWPWVGKKLPALKRIPAPMIVLLVAVPMGLYLDLLHEHSYTLRGHKYQLDDHYLVDMPDRVFGMFDYVTFPDLAALGQIKAWKWVMMFFIIGSLESLLSAKAVDLLDPWKRKTNLDRDVMAVGVANLCAASVGGLPMISEIVRSKANIDNGARTRFADMWHGLFLLACVALIPMLLHAIPLAALAGMLVYTGYRLAHPTEFIHIYRIGKEQLAIFIVTMVMVLATDLLIGVLVGILLKLIIHIVNGVPIRSLFKPFLEVQSLDAKTSLIVARESAVFSNWIPFKRQIENIGLVQKRNLVLDVSDAKLVDNSVMEKLEEMERDFELEGLKLEIRGLEELQPVSENANATRKGGLSTIRRITIISDQHFETWLREKCLQFGATGYTSSPCVGAGRRDLAAGSVKDSQVRMEVIALPRVCNAILESMRHEIKDAENITVCVETVEVPRFADFVPENTTENDT